MRILFISQLFDPEYSIKGLELMKHWQSNGHEVEVITTYPNYPTGKVFEGYDVRFSSCEEVEKVKITRLWSYISHSSSKLARALSYMTFTIMALFTALCRKDVDLIYTYHPQSTTGLIGILMSGLRGVPFITDVQDLWPDALAATGVSKNTVVLKLIGWWYRLIYRRAAHIIVLSKGYKKRLVEQGVRPEKITVIYNWCPEERLIETVLAEAASESNADNSAPMHLMYAGNMGAAQSLATLVEAVGTFRRDQVTLTLIGGGVEKSALKELIQRNSTKNVQVKDYVSPEEIFYVLLAADVLVVHLRDTALFRVTIPSKTQSSLAMGKPIMMAVGGETNDLLAPLNAGVIAEPGRKESLIAAINELMDKRDQWPEMGVNARAFYQQEFSMSKNYIKLDQVLVAIESA